MPMNFNAPVTSDSRAAVLQAIRDHQIALARMLDGETLTGTPTNAIRYNSGQTRFEKFNGTTWDPLPLNFLPLAGGTMTGALITDNLGVRTPAVDRPFITKAFNLFTSGNYNGLGRYGLFMEPGRVVLGYPSDTGTTPSVIRYNADSSIANEWVILHAGNFNSFALPLTGGTLSGALNGTTAAFSGAVTVSGGNAVWHAGNFNPSSYQLASTAWNTGNFNPSLYMPLSGGTFTNTVSGTIFQAPLIRATGAGGFLGFQQRDNTSIEWGWYATGGVASLWNGGANVANFNTNGNASVTGEFAMGNRLEMRGSQPTINFRDTDHRSAFIHINSNLFYILRGGTDATTWDSGPNGRHPMTMNLDNGDVTFSGNVTAYSDERLKKNIREYHIPYWALRQIPLAQFDMDNGQSAGTIAQRVQKVAPLFVREDKDGYLSVDYGRLAFAMVASLARELSNRNVL